MGKGAQTISQSLPLPMYAGMEETLRRRIADSTYPLGSSLPSESSLAEEFRVSRFTAREALRRLGEAGLIQSQQGARSRVIGRHPHGAYTFSVSSAEDIQQYARETHLVSTSVRALEARGALARFLRCRDKREWLLLTGTRIESKTGTVVGHTKVYLWAEFEPHITEVTKRGRPIHRQIETKLGVHTSNIRQEITAIPMPADAAEALSFPVGSPALEIVRRYFGSRGRPFEVARNIHPAGSFTYTQEFQRRGEPQLSPGLRPS